MPIHAAGNYRSGSTMCTADYVVSSYIPTVTSLSKARHCWTPIMCSDLAGLIVCEASATNEESMAYLPHAFEEAVSVRKCLKAAGARVLNEDAVHTSPSELQRLLKGTPTHVLHMACHGVQHSDPLKSSFLLHDGRLSLEDIIQLNLPHAFLAFLSACQTAKGDKNAPDQAVHLAASMLFCGFRSVIGTMW
jgi:CHAT domain-containing protein